MPCQQTAISYKLFILCREGSISEKGKLLVLIFWILYVQFWSFKCFLFCALVYLGIYVLYTYFCIKFSCKYKHKDIRVANTCEAKFKVNIRWRVYLFEKEICSITKKTVNFRILLFKFIQIKKSSWKYLGNTVCMKFLISTNGITLGIHFLIMIREHSHMTSDF